MKRKEIVLKNVSPLVVFKTSTLFLASLIAFIGAGMIMLALFTKGWKAFADTVLGTLFGIFILSPAYGVVSSCVVILYNWVAKKTGGYRMTLEIEEKDS